jgi:NAD(P)-dependent dehydrogenase (short-subunit alcohol dehydrogenase family)
MPQLLVFGARNLGRVIAEHLIAQGWEATGVARSEETVAAFPGRGLQADLTDRDQMRRVVEEAGAFDLAVNAYSPKGRFGGGDLTTTDDDAMAPYLEQLLPEVFSFYRLVGASLADRGAGTLIQVTGGSARRALPGRAPWASGAAATRALSQAAANELKPKGVHACLLICDGGFGGAGDDDGGKKIDTTELARAVNYLHEQGRSAWTHELVVTPVGDRWTP